MNCVAALEKSKQVSWQVTDGRLKLVGYLKKGDSNDSFSNPYVFNGRRQTMGELWCRIEVLQLTQLEDSAILELRHYDDLSVALSQTHFKTTTCD